MKYFHMNLHVTDVAAVSLFMKLKTARNAFISGLLMLAPVGVTIFVIKFLVETLGGPASRLFFFFIDDSLLETNPMLNVAVVIISAFIVVILITLFGWFTSFIIGKFFMGWIEKTISTVPLVRSVYMTVKQIVDTFSRSNKAVFRKTVLTEYPRKGVYVIGFVTGECRGEIQDKTKEFLINVFVPTTPNPTSGFLLLVPQREVIELDMSVSDGMKAIISGGAVMPSSISEPPIDQLPIQNPKA
jgi:uncharacterized membrane protein